MENESKVLGLVCRATLGALHDNCSPIDKAAGLKRYSVKAFACDSSKYDGFSFSQST